MAAKAPPTVGNSYCDYWHKKSASYKESTLFLLAFFNLHLLLLLEYEVHLVVLHQSKQEHSSSNLELFKI